MPPVAAAPPSTRPAGRASAHPGSRPTLRQGDRLSVRAIARLAVRPGGRERAARPRTGHRSRAGVTGVAILAVAAGALLGALADRVAARMVVARTNRRLGGRIGGLDAPVRVTPPSFPYLLNAATGRQPALELSATASYGELRRLRRGHDAHGNSWDDPAYVLMSLFGGYAGVFGDSCGPLVRSGDSGNHRWTDITYGGGDRLSVGTEIALADRSLQVRIVGTPLVRDGRLALVPEEIVLGDQRLPGVLMTPERTAVFAEPVVALPAFPRGTRLADVAATPEGLRLRLRHLEPHHAPGAAST